MNAVSKCFFKIHLLQIWTFSYFIKIIPRMFRIWLVLGLAIFGALAPFAILLWFRVKFCNILYYRLWIFQICIEGSCDAIIAKQLLFLSCAKSLQLLIWGWRATLSYSLDCIYFYFRKLGHCLRAILFGTLITLIRHTLYQRTKSGGNWYALDLSFSTKRCDESPIICLA